MYSGKYFADLFFLHAINTKYICLLCCVTIMHTHAHTQTVAEFQVALVSETDKTDTYLIMLYKEVSNMDGAVAGFTCGK